MARGLERKPSWLRVRIPCGKAAARVNRLLRAGGLHTVCESAMCPNIGACWANGRATFLILGAVCTRSCRFCAVGAGRPSPADPAEPRRVARAAKAMDLRDVVITSVTRDDLKDGGAEIWAETIRLARKDVPGCTIEALYPDFGGSARSIETALSARPDIAGHNLETVPSLYRRVRPRASYRRSLKLLATARERGLITKTSLMLGLGETRNQVHAAMRDAREAGCDIFFAGQYLQPTAGHLPVERYVPPEEFDELAEYGKRIGFDVVVAGPLVRSSFWSAEQDAYVLRRMGTRRFF